MTTFEKFGLLILLSFLIGNTTGCDSHGYVYDEKMNHLCDEMPENIFPTWVSEIDQHLAALQQSTTLNFEKDTPTIHLPDDSLFYRINTKYLSKSEKEKITSMLFEGFSFEGKKWVVLSYKVVTYGAPQLMINQCLTYDGFRFISSTKPATEKEVMFHQCRIPINDPFNSYLHVSITKIELSMIPFIFEDDSTKSIQDVEVPEKLPSFFSGAKAYSILCRKLAQDNEPHSFGFFVAGLSEEQYAEFLSTSFSKVPKL